MEEFLFGIKVYQFKAEEKVMYPSVSVCRKYAYDQESLDFEYHYYYDYDGVNTFIEWINNYSIGMEFQFYFFTLPGVENLTFPCTTTPGGMGPLPRSSSSPGRLP